MAKSKTNKSHLKRVNNFKNQQKAKTRNMSEQKIPKAPFTNQYPVWNSQDIIEVTGLEYEALHNAANIFRNAVMANEAILQRNMQSGKIKWVYKDANNKEVAPELVQKYNEEVQAFFQAQEAAQAKNKPITAEEQKDLPRIDALTDSDGKELKSEE